MPSDASMIIPPALATRYIFESSPSPLSSFWLVREPAGGQRAWLQAPGQGEEELAKLTNAATALSRAAGNHTLRLIRSELTGAAPHLLFRWQAEMPWPFPPQHSLGAALQLLVAIHSWQQGVSPLALPGLELNQLLLDPYTGQVKLADFVAARLTPDSAELRAGRTACCAILEKLLATATGPPGNGIFPDLAAAWENNGAEAYTPLRDALQRLALARVLEK